jgi:hypothetical protein
VEDVARALESYTPADDLRYPSLAGGAAGEALFHAYLALHNGDEHQAERAAALLETAAQALATTVMPPGLYSGFSGVAWVAEHLQARLFEPDPEGDDPNREIDEALLAYLGTLTEADEYDLISGVTGLGVYARERLSFPSGAVLLERVVDRLATQAETGSEGTAWFTPPNRLPECSARSIPRTSTTSGSPTASRRSSRSPPSPAGARRESRPTRRECRPARRESRPARRECRPAMRECRAARPRPRSRARPGRCHQPGQVRSTTYSGTS